MEGIVNWFNKEKGYGFIIGKDNSEYFVHNSEVVEGNFLNENDKVIFEPIESDKGKQAMNVSLVKKEEPVQKKPVQEVEEPKEDLSSQQGPGDVMNLS